MPFKRFENMFMILRLFKKDRNKKILCVYYVYDDMLLTQAKRLGGKKLTLYNKLITK